MICDEQQPLMLINIFKWVTDLSTIWNVCRIDFKDKLKKNYKLQRWLQFILTESASFQQTNHVELILIFYTRLQQESYDCIQHTSPITLRTSQTFGNIFNSKFPSFFFSLLKQWKDIWLLNTCWLFLFCCVVPLVPNDLLGDHCSSQSYSPYRALGRGGVLAHSPADKQMIVPRSSDRSGWCVATGWPAKPPKHYCTSSMLRGGSHTWRYHLFTLNQSPNF